MELAGGPGEAPFRLQEDSNLQGPTGWLDPERSRGRDEAEGLEGEPRFFRIRDGLPEFAGPCVILSVEASVACGVGGWRNGGR
jgi:hypothetical protein